MASVKSHRPLLIVEEHAIFDHVEPALKSVILDLNLSDDGSACVTVAPHRGARSALEFKSVIVEVLPQHRACFGATIPGTRFGAFNAHMRLVSVVSVNDPTAIFLYHSDSARCLKVFHMDCGVQFLKWVSQSVLSIVTLTAVWHWYISKSPAGSGPPKCLFTRNTLVHGWTPVDYRFCAASGVSALVVYGAETVTAKFGTAVGESGAVQTRVQVLHAERGTSEVLAGSCVALYDGSRIGPNSSITPVVLAAGWNFKQKRGTLELDGMRLSGDMLPIFDSQQVILDDGMPVAVHIIDQYALAFVVSECGYVHLIDIESGTHLGQVLVKQGSRVYATAPCFRGLGVMIVYGPKRHTATIRIVPPYLMSGILREPSIPLSALFRIAGRNEDEDLYVRHHLDIAAKYPSESIAFLRTEWGDPHKLRDIISQSPSLGSGQFRATTVMRLRGTILFLVGLFSESHMYASAGAELDPSERFFSTLDSRCLGLQELLNAAEEHISLDSLYSERMYTAALQVMGVWDEEAFCAIVRAHILARRGDARCTLFEQSGKLALEDTNASLELHQQQWEAYYVRAKVLQRRDEHNRAISDFARALQHADNSEAKEMIERLLDEASHRKGGRRLIGWR
ncbi:hypothetical protein BKA62DRAFT_739196 [Auriculariales sp. MPI-PUGE-AT-0066]|nr:hypothetical protein BKA62DRAFT_739196 [Auriculariales sp. MPI-PUGE-AT-0066]